MQFARLSPESTSTRQRARSPAMGTCPRAWLALTPGLSLTPWHRQRGVRTPARSPVWHFGACTTHRRCRPSTCWSWSSTRRVSVKRAGSHARLAASD